MEPLNHYNKKLIFIFHIFATIIPICYSCSSHSFPKVIGGTSQSTLLYQLDYHLATDRIIAVGSTQDYQIRGDIGINSDTRGIVVSYQGSPTYDITWAKYLDTYPTEFISVQFEPTNGDYAIVYNTLGSFLMFHAGNGTLFFYAKNIHINTTTNTLTRNSILRINADSTFSIYGEACETYTTQCDVYYLIKYNVNAEYDGQNKWVSFYKTTVQKSYHMQFDSTSNALIVALQMYDQSIRIIDVNVTSGAIIKNFNFNSSTALQITSMIFTFVYNGADRFIYTAVADNTQGIIINKVGTNSVGFKLTLPSTGYLSGPYELKGITAFVTNVLVFIVQGFTTQDYYIVQATMQSTSTKFKFQRAFPGAFSFLGLGYIKNYDNAFAVGNNNKIPMSLDEGRDVYQTISSFSQGIIMYSSLSASCIRPTNTASIDTIQEDEGNLVAFDLIVQKTWTNYFDSTTTLGLFGYNLVEPALIKDLLLNQMTSQDDWCQVQSWYYFYKGQAILNQPFSAVAQDFTSLCTANTTTLITYSLNKIYNQLLDSGVTFSGTSTREITLSTSATSATGIKYMMVTGQYDSIVKVYAFVRIQIIEPLPPVFDSALFSEITMNQRTVKQYTLPTFTDPSGLDVEVQIDTNAIADGFVTTDFTNYVMKFTPTQASQIGDHIISITLTNTYQQTDYFFNLKVINDPPYFINSLYPQSQKLPLNSDLLYTLPDFKDNEQDVLYVTHSTNLPQFVQFDSSINQYLISPNKASYIGISRVDGGICDEINQCTQFFFNIEVTNLPPIMREKLTEQTVIVGERGEYLMPLVEDPEGLPVKITASLQGGMAFPNFIKFESKTTTFTFSPQNPLSDVGRYKISVEITDNYARPLTSTFYLNVNLPPEPAPQPEATQTNPAEDGSTLPVDNEEEEDTLQSSSINTAADIEQQQQLGREVDQAISNAFKSQSFSNFDPKTLGSLKKQMLKQKKKAQQFFFFKGTLKAISVTKQAQLKIRIRADQHAQDLVKLILEKHLQLTMVKSDEKGTRTQIEYFNITSRNNEQFIVKMILPNDVSLGIELDKVEVKLVQGLLKLGENYLITMDAGQKSEIEIPLQLSESEAQLTQGIQKATDFASKAALPVGFVLNISLSICIQYIWGFLNDLSFLTIQSMIGISLPGISQVIQGAFLNFIYLDILMTDQWLIPILFPENSSGFSEDGPLNSQFDENGFSSMILLKNLGSTFLYFIMLLFAFILLGFTALFSSCNPFHKWLRGKLLWNTTIRFVLAQFPPIFMASIINLYQMSFGTTIGEAFSSFLAVIFIIACLITIFALTQVQYGNDMKNEEYEDRYGNLTEGMNVEKMAGRYWNVAVLARWLVTTVALVTLWDHPGLQIMIMMLLSCVFQGIVIVGQPFDNKIDNRITFINELMASFYLYLIISETDYNSINPFKQEIGQAIVYLVLFSVFMNFLKFAILCAREIKKSLNKLCQQRKIVQQAKQEKSDNTNDFAILEINEEFKSLQKQKTLKRSKSRTKAPKQQRKSSKQLQNNLKQKDKQNKAINQQIIQSYFPASPNPRIQKFPFQQTMNQENTQRMSKVSIAHQLLENNSQHNNSLIEQHNRQQSYDQLIIDIKIQQIKEIMEGQRNGIQLPL